MERAATDLVADGTLSEEHGVTMKKIYYQMIFDARSPLRIGNGRDCSSDSDLMLDGRGLPFIPGTSIAGIVRHRVEEINGNKAMLERLFGTVEIAETSNCDPRIIPSAIFFSDAVMNQDASEKDVVIGKRDGVGLGEWGTAKNTSKFDFLISELDKKLYAIIEWTGDEKQEETEISDVIEPVMKHYISSGFHAGARTSRGYGDFKVEIRKKIFMFPAELEKWIEFDPYADDAFLNAVELSGGLLDMNVEIEVGFKMVGTFSVRVNTARSKIMEDGSVPDTVPLEDHSGNPVIPGTVWAGAFRHHMHDLLRDIGYMEKSAEMKELDHLFGMADDAKDNKKSVICFSESRISIEEKSEQKMSVIRTAIDRFTASPRTASLFTNMVYSGGEGELHISFNKNAVSDKYRQLLAACIYDMHLGLLSVGGEASVGRGIMQVTQLKVNGEEKFGCMRNLSENENVPLDWLKEEKKNA